jgi:FG-GAP-like repeat
VCHDFPEPKLLDKKTWVAGVLPQMAPRLGVAAQSLSEEMSRDPRMVVLPQSVSMPDWEAIVAYYREQAPDSLPDQSLPSVPTVDPNLFKVGPFAPDLKSSGIITLLQIDSIHRRIFVGEAGSNTLRVFDFSRRLLSTTQLGSPPTALVVDNADVLVLESGILNPNDEPRGSLLRFGVDANGSLRKERVVIDSLIRPVFFQQFDFDGDGKKDYLICEFGNNVGRLALYHAVAFGFERRVLDPGPGAVRFEIRDMTGDGAPDVVALFAQANERIVLFENDGKGNFTKGERVLAHFPPVYGSMYFSLHDFNGDGNVDILYVNGDNFDYSRVLKPYHGLRILENDGRNNFRERFFFPIYGAARAEAADFDGDGDLDIVATSNFADVHHHPERSIMFFQNDGGYNFRPYAFTIAANNQWNLSAVGDLNADGRPDVIVGAMDLGSIARFQQQYSAGGLETTKQPILFFENTIQKK